MSMATSFVRFVLLWDWDGYRGWGVGRPAADFAQQLAPQSVEQ